MKNMYSFRELENAVLYAGDLLNLGVDSVLIQTIRQKPLEDSYVVTVIEDYDGISPRLGSEKPQTISTSHPSDDSAYEALDWIDPY